MDQERNAAIAAGLLRISLGAVLIAHALLKLFVFTLPGTAQFFAAQGFPGWTAYPVTFAELFAGTLLVAGIGSRIAALAVLPVLLGAAWVHAGNGWLFTAPNGGWEYPVLLAVLAVAVALLGDGAFAASGAMRPRMSVRRVVAATAPVR